MGGPNAGPPRSWAFHIMKHSDGECMVKMEKTEQVINALRNRYDDNGWSYAFLEQVSDGTGKDCNRWADALAVQLWTSRGLEIIGFEIKVSRQDWIKELKQPQKADAIAKYCHRWYLVVGDTNIVQFGELPMNWGLMAPYTKKSLKIVKPAVINKNPKPVDMSFLCAILRRTTQQLTDRAVKNVEYQRGYDEGFKHGKEELDYLRESKNEQLDTLQNKIKDFQERSGVNINDWHHTPSQIGDAVKMVLNQSYLKEFRNLERLKERAEEITKEIGSKLQEHKRVDFKP